MILRLLKLIVFLFLIGVISTFISYTEGRTKIDWLGWGIDLETSHFIMILIFVSFFFIFIDRLWRLVISFPKSALLRRDERNREKVEKNLVKAFLLASHGEYKQAAKEALLISKNTKDKKLGLLIKEHSDAVEAQNEVDQINVSNKYFNTLANDKNTSFIGHLASMRVELGKKNDFNKIYEHANEAYKLEPNSEQVVKILFYTSIKLNKIKRAIEISKNPIIINLFSEEKYKQTLSDLHYIDGVNKFEKNKKEAEKAFSKSVENFEGNVLAILKLTKLFKGISAKNKSINILKNCFFISPHEDILNQLIKRVNYKTSGERVSYAIRLIGDEKISASNINEIKIQVAKFAVKEKIWGEAKKILEGINEENRTNLSYQLLAEIAGSQNKQDEVKEYLKNAAKAKLGFSFFCSNCGYDNQTWKLNCNSCNELSSIKWQDRPVDINLNKNLINFN